MKWFLGCMSLTLTLTVFANNFYLSEQDQKYFKNDSMVGNNQFERIELNVKEINKLHGEIATLKAQVEALKKDVELLKKGNAVSATKD